MFNLKRINIKIVLIVVLISITVHSTNAKLKWKVKPQKYQVAKENEQVQLNCEFEEDNEINNNSSELSKNFVIWYKDGASHNVLSLNDQLGANLNSLNYEIKGKYNLIIRNLTRNHSGLYTCQLFQSSDLVASVNLTVLVAPKYAKVNVKYADDITEDNLIEQSSYITAKTNKLIKINSKNKGYFVEDDRVYLECCTNGDVNPQAIFKWSRVNRKHPNNKYIDFDMVNMNTRLVKANDGNLCNLLLLNLTRHDNNHMYKCSVTNDAFLDMKPQSDNINLTVEYKPEVNLHLGGFPLINKKLSIIENSSLTLFCNASAQPGVTAYEWYLNDERIMEFRTDTLPLHNLQRNQVGTFACKCFNRHGETKSIMKIDVLYANIITANKTTSSSSPSLKKANVVYLNTYENKSITLSCQIDSNPRMSNVNWYYYQINKDNKIINKVSLNQIISTSSPKNKNQYTNINLNNLASTNTGYYTCEINYILTDNLNQTFIGISDATYFLQVQYAPLIQPTKRIVYSNNYDQVELKCDVKSNPQSVISWYFGTKELFTSYKYNISSILYKQINRNILDEYENYHYYRSNLVVNSVGQFDYGDYYCKANNIIGERTQIISLKHKHKPETPIDFRALETTSNSVLLTWISGLNGGENSTFLINVNQEYNATIFTEDELFNKESDLINRHNTIELKGLNPLQTYEFRLIASNSMGSSDFTPTIKIRTQKPLLKAEKLPLVHNAQFNDIREAICFDIDINSPTSHFLFNQQLKDIIIKLDIEPNESELNKGTLERIQDIPNKIHKLRQNELQAQFQSKSSSLLVTLSKLKYGQNCIPYSQLIELDQYVRNITNSRSANFTSTNLKHNKRVFYLNNKLISISPLTNNNNKSLVENYGKNFFEFKRMNRINIAICYMNDSTICAEKLAVLDYNTDFSTYVTLIAIGCSAILIFIMLLISSICCCCCCRKRTAKSENEMDNKKKNDINSKLVIKSFPIVTNQQSNFEYSTDGSTKSLQHNILNGVPSSGSHSSGSGRGSTIGDAGSSSSGIGTNDVVASDEVNFYKNEANFAFSSSSSSSNNHNRNTYMSSAYIQNASSLATVESDISSSVSIENKPSSINGEVTKMNGSNSPFSVINEANNNQVNHNGYFSPISSSTSSYSNKHSLKPTTIVYNSSQNMFIKVQNQKQSQQVASKQVPIIKNDSPESGYSTPVNKRLVYEVIV